jgi:Holliday junction resolvase RusA-like endonuclease
MDAIRFSMVGEPRGKGRPRATIRGAHASVYTDAATRKYEASITKLARHAMGNRPPLQGPLLVALRFRMPIPKSATKRDKAAMAAGEITHTARPDIDNLSKAVLDGIAEDAALKIAMRKKPHAYPPGSDARVMFLNDSQITGLSATKVYSDKPGVDVRVEALAPQPGAPA